MTGMNGPRIYVDHAATTPMREEAIAAMLPYLASVGYNPSSLHAEGRASRNALDTARERVAAALGARPREIVFVGSGSESDNLAIAGTVRAAQTKNAIARPHVVTVATEHHAVVHAVDRLAEDGVAVTKLDVDEDGRVDPAAFEAALRPSTVLASVMLANNEIGTIAPIAELAAIAHAHGVPFHTDAVQTPGRLPLDVRALGVDLLTLSGHKFYGPKGVGMLYVRTGTPLAAAIHGGGQEFGLRAGTENVAGIVAFAAALELAVREEPTESPRLAALRDRLEAGVRATVTGVLVNAARARRLPNIASIAFEGTTAPDLLASLDLDGVAASAGSACAAGAVEPSHVLAALGGPPWRRVATIRFSLGKLTSERDIELLIGVIGASVRRLRVVPTELGMGANGQVIRGPEVRS
jgi:cysteine desulfurase